MLRFPIVLLTLIGALYCSAASGQEGGEPKIRKPKVDLPVADRAWGNPVAAVYTHGWWFKGSERGNPDAIRPRVTVAVWADGHIVWSDDSIEGGPPYREATLEPARVEELLKDLEGRGVFADPGPRRYFPPDSNWTAIVVLDQGKYLNMQLWHLMDRDPEREWISKNQPEKYEEYQNFRRVWAEVKGALLELIPREQGKPSDVSFTAERVSVEQP